VVKRRTSETGMMQKVKGERGEANKREKRKQGRQWVEYRVRRPTNSERYGKAEHRRDQISLTFYI